MLAHGLLIITNEKPNAAFGVLLKYIKAQIISVLYIFYGLKTILILNMFWLYYSPAQSPSRCSLFPTHPTYNSFSKPNIKYNNKTPPNQENKVKHNPPPKKKHQTITK